MAHKEKLEKKTNRAGLVEYLRGLLSQAEEGYIMVGERKVELPEEFELEIKYKEEGHKKEIEWEIEWKS